MKNYSIAMTVALLAGLCVFATACGELNPNTQGQIASALEGKSDRFEKCYKSALKRNRNTKGKMTVELSVDKDSGKVTKAKVVKSNIKDKTMKKCVSKAAKKIKVPEAPGKHVKGVYQLEFAFEK